MESVQTSKKKTQYIAGLGVMTAIVIILQIFGSSIRFGPFSISLVNVPLTIGAVLFGTAGGAWLGFVFGLVVLLTGDAAPFLVVNILGTVLTVLLKGILAGVASAFVYRLFPEDKKNLGVVAAALTCPVVNTGVFLIGCLLFFMETLAGWAEGAGFSGNVAGYMLLGLVGTNFLVELAVSATLTPIILRLLGILKRGKFRSVSN